MQAVYLAILAGYVGAILWANNNGSAAETGPVRKVFTVFVFGVAPFNVACCGNRTVFSPGFRYFAAAQTLLFFMASAIAWQSGAISRELVSPVYVCAGLALGHILFALSVLATEEGASSRLSSAWHCLSDIGGAWDFAVSQPVVLMRFMAVATGEEMMYRAGAQTAAAYLLGNPWAAIVIVALGFALVHRHFLRNTPAQSTEFLAFSLLLGLLYHCTHSLALVILIHAVRNIEIAWIESGSHSESPEGEEDQLQEDQSEYEEGRRVVALVMLPDLSVATLDYVTDGGSRTV